MVVLQWNRWVEEQDGECVATLAEFKIGNLGCYVD